MTRMDAKIIEVSDQTHVYCTISYESLLLLGTIGTFCDIQQITFQEIQLFENRVMLLVKVKPVAKQQI
jgi:hypothetical protein